MNAIATTLREIFPPSDFGAAASIDAVELAEREIGCKIPSPLRELYLEFDGFYGPTAIPFFYRLGSRDDDPSLVYWNVLFRAGQEFSSEFMSRYLFFGSDGCGGNWAVPLSGDVCIVRWYPDMGDRVERLTDDFVRFWSEQKSLYD
jgi:hypothetical protein